jgi:TetR/AcrR family transcriptional repressor of nem operon
MKKSKVETAETKRRIIAMASQEFQRNGIHATGLADVMAAAGLTHGGFYRHFQSKDQLVAEACAARLETFAEAMEAAGSKKGGLGDLRAIIERYLTMDERDGRTDGCPLAGLGSELARADPDTRSTASAGFMRLIDAVAARIRRRSSKVARSDAMFALVAMIGAVTMSRVVTDPKVARSILEETEDHILRACGPAAKSTD